MGNNRTDLGRDTADNDLTAAGAGPGAVALGWAGGKHWQTKPAEASNIMTLSSGKQTAIYVVLA